MRNKIPFSPPDINEEDIQEVIDVLRSGWITTGPKVKEFSAELSKWCANLPVNCLNSATAGLELSLKVLGIGPDDEVITTPFTFTATASVIIHAGAKPVFADIEDDSFNIDPEEIGKKITPRTKAVITVDYAGYPCNYYAVKDILTAEKNIYNPSSNTMQQDFSSLPLIADASHSFGALINNNSPALLTDFTAFSFHAVKNLTTAEGGALVINTNSLNNKISEMISLMSLHGQNKDAYTRNTWEYDVVIPGYKRNMTDIQAALGVSQLKRYSSMLLRRKEVHDLYYELLKDNEKIILPCCAPHVKPSYHIMPVRLRGADENQRNMVIQKLNEKNISVNVHFIPLPMLTLYKKMGFSIKDYPRTFAKYENVLTLPLNTTLTNEEVIYICDNLNNILKYF